jgi:hypothetical protein
MKGLSSVGWLHIVVVILIFSADVPVFHARLPRHVLVRSCCSTFYADAMTLARYAA